MRGSELMSETKNINDLKANPKNPRTINKHDFNALVEAIKKFGDLSGIVFNQMTGQLVGGHQRIEAFKRIGGQPIIEEKLDTPNSVGTIARGYVLLNDEKFTYREVVWEKGFEQSANVAANRIQGQFDLDLLAEITFEISQNEEATGLLKLTGQTEDEINRLLKMSGAVDAGTEEEQGKLDKQDHLACPNCQYQGSENDFRKASSQAQA